MLTDNTRIRAREMTSDLSIYHGPAATMAVVLLEHMDCVAELEELRTAHTATVLAMGDDRLKLRSRVAELEEEVRCVRISWSSDHEDKKDRITTLQSRHLSSAMACGDCTRLAWGLDAHGLCAACVAVRGEDGS